MQLVDACTYYGGKRLATICTEGVFRGFNTLTGQELWCDALNDTFRPKICQANAKGLIVVCDENSIHFVRATEETYTLHGSATTQVSSDISFVRWLSVRDLFLVACQNGELYLLRFPEPCAEDTVHMVESLIQGTWWLDFPFLDMFPCFVHGEGDIINLLVHSADKDTKLYALEKKRDSETKVLRPLFLMRDHSSGGTQIGRLTDTTIFSSGADGRVVIRDIAHYQTKLSPIPPSKEKRKPEKEIAVRQFGRGGVSSVCLTAGGLLVCGSRHDGVLHLVRPDIAPVPSWKEPTWTRRKIKPLMDALSGNSEDAGQESETRRKGNLQQQRQELYARLETLKASWAAAMVDKDPQVPVSALVVDRRKEEFETECEEAIDTMNVDEYYHTLTNEFTQDNIRKKCCDTMDVSRCKITSLLILGVEVHNYQILKATRERQQLVRKVAFLRKLQLKASTGHRFHGLREMEETTVIATAENGNANAGTDAALSASPSSLFYAPQDLYTHSRLIIQGILLRSRVLELKDAFNRKFTDLRELKKGVLSQMEERNQRCVKILRQLDQPIEGLFHPYVDPEEDMSTLFTVADDELPPDVRELLQHKSDVTIYSPANEAALKQWMDGLEKDVDVVRVHITPPDFADETKDSFVPPDERTEDQLRIVDEYEKKLKEETEAVNQRKEALRNEFAALQKETQKAATQVDEELKVLQQTRLVASEQIDEAELYAISLFQHVLLVAAFYQQYAHLNTEARRAQKKVVYTRTLLEAKRTSANAILAEIESLEEEYGKYISSVCDDAPFNDKTHGDKMIRRLTRWKNKYDENKATVPSKETPVDNFPPDLWAAFCDHCEELSEMKSEINTLDEQHRAETEAFTAIEEQVHNWENQVNECNVMRATIRREFVSHLLDTTEIYYLHQGQIQDESATATSDFKTSFLRWDNDVHAHNKLLLQSDSEAQALLQKIGKRKKNMKQTEWETERLQYCIGTLEMELRHLHTLRITRQMQEWLSGDVSATEERTLEGIAKHMDFVNVSMKKKVDDLHATALRLKAQIADRTTENGAIDGQFQQLKGNVEDLQTVQTMVEAHADGSEHFTRRAKDIYETAELEELARTQQEELLRLKREVDRLRERTFPSFAVVSKRTM
ncbi:WD repeat-containing protein 96 [Strigomonas culicis]|uniref:Cilia- and flagella-associated protein 43 n=1 Tax=Strigomonas culicis TaxID=28005 RepID=S9VCT7_9TRYP|nr:WD repeat-containing protein 96 [Strigomonas culicis]|eukprot:EPY24816.1 WD repeat-containing protein 96 [Strigomonas culicis]